MIATDLLAGSLLGGCGAAAHLGVTRARARLAVAGRPRSALLLLPAGLSLIALAVIAAAAIAPVAAWAAPIGVVSLRFVVLRRVARASGGPP